MTPAEFRRDRRLRSSASHLSTWSIVALAGTALADLHLPPWQWVPLGALLLAAGALAAHTSERRIGKMVGPAGEPCWPGIERSGCIWALATALAVAAMLAAGRADAVPALVLCAVGAGLACWGRAARFGWYVGLGLVLVAAGVADLAAAWWVRTDPAGPGSGWRTALRVLVLGVWIPGLALETNRRFLWWRKRP